MRLFHIATAASLLAIAAPALSQEYTAYRAIAAKDYAAAERRLVALRRGAPDRPELMLNLAAVYAKTGRGALARDLYVEVLRRPALLMDMPSGRVASSHAVARFGLLLLEADTLVAAR